MRCFVSIQLPSYIKDNLANLQKELNSQYAKIRWVFPKNLHITIKFFGEIDEDKLNLIKETLGNVKFNKFKIGLGELDWFPSKERVNIIWVDLNPKAGILNLQGEIELKLNNLIAKDHKFEVHLTLGRVKFVKNKDEFLNILKNKKVRWDSFLVDEFCLIKSELSKDGPRYTVLEKYSLE